MAFTNPFVSLTAPPEGGSYEQQMAALLRQQQQAEQMRSDMDTPIRQFSSKMGPAPIGWGSVLAKALKGVGANMKEARAEEGRKKLSAEDRATADALAQRLMQGDLQNQVGAPGIAPSTTTVSGTLPQLPGQAPPQAGPQATLQLPGQQGGGMQQGYRPLSAQEQMAAIMQAHGGPETQAIKQAMLPRVFAKEDTAEARAYEEQRSKMRFATADEKRAAGIDPRTVAQMDANGKITPVTDPNQITALQQRELANQDRSYGLQRQQFGLQQQQANRPVAYGPGTTLYDPRTNKPIATTPLSLEDQQKQQDFATNRAGAVVTADRSINTLEKMMGMPGRDKAVGMQIPFVNNIPGMQPYGGTEAADFTATLKAFQSQAFLNQVKQMRGLGALTEAEGAKLVAAVGALDPNMTREAFKESAAEIWRDFTTARNKLPGATPRKFGETAPWMQPPDNGVSIKRLD